MPSCACSVLLLQVAGLACWLASLPGEPDTSFVDASSGTKKTVVITGGTSGLGRQAVLFFAARGDTVYTCGRRVERIRELNSVPGVYATAVDLSKPEEVTAWAEKIFLEASGPDGLIDVLVNNAGILRIGDPIAVISMANYGKVMDVNVRGVVGVTGAFWRRLRRPTGIVVNLGSTTETPKLGQVFHSIYSMSKGALRAFSNGLRQEGRLAGVQVVHVKAGMFDSELHGSFDHAGKTLSEEYAHTEFAVHASSLQRTTLENLKMVTPASPERFARMLYAMTHLPSGMPRQEYWLNVSWLEMLVAWLPEALLDWVVLQSYDVQASASSLAQQREGSGGRAAQEL